MNALVEPILLEPSQKGHAAETLAQAFRDDPMYAYVFPEIDDRLRYTRRMAEALITYSLLYGEVFATSALTGIACWLRPGQTEMSLRRSVRTGFALERAVIAFPKEARERMLGIVGHMEKLRKQAMQRPYWYLWIIGVRPDSQGQGIGSSLLQPVLQRADAGSLPCYLETETASNVAFYEKRGFAVQTVQQVAGHGLTLWTMIREPQ